LPPVGGVATNFFIFSITGGTGLFAGATGTLSGPGQGHSVFVGDTDCLMYETAIELPSYHESTT
jgi:hypothetical protein